MQRYANRSGDSGITAYEAGPDYILVQFRSGTSYRYSYARAGQVHVEQMKILAASGRGLSGYISKYVHDLADPR